MTIRRGRFMGFIRTTQKNYLTITNVDLGQGIAVIKLNHEGNVIWIKEINEPDLQFMDGFGVEEVTNGYLITGYQQDVSYQTQAFIYKLSQDGEVLWKRDYGGANSDFAGTIKKRNDNSYFIGGGEAKPQSGIGEPGFWLRTWLFEIDSSGNLLWEWKTNISERMDGGSLFEFAGDTAIVYASSRMPQYVSPWLTEFVLRKVDLNSGATLWQKAQTGADMTYLVSYGDLEASPIDGGWDLVGTYQHYPNGFVSGGLSVHTSADGDLVWMREDTAWLDPNLNVDENYLNCLEHLSSGSIIAGGDVLKSEPVWHNEAWLLKISPKGCIGLNDCAPLVSATSALPAGEVFSPWPVYPNPTSGRALLLPDQQANGRQGNLTLFDAAGRQVFAMDFPFQANEPVPLELNRLPPGIYHYQVRLDGREVGGEKVLIGR